MKRSNILQIHLILVLLLVAGCGYQFSGLQQAPFNMRYITVSMFENKTSEIGVESVLANDLIFEVTRDGRMVLSKIDRADAVFSGTVKSMDVQTISREKGYAAAERRVNLSVDVKLKDRNDNLLWAAKNISASEAYLVTDNKLATEHNRKLAIAEVSRKIVQDIYQQLNQNF